MDQRLNLTVSFHQDRRICENFDRTRFSDSEIKMAALSIWNLLTA